METENIPFRNFNEPERERGENFILNIFIANDRNKPEKAKENFKISNINKFILRENISKDKNEELYISNYLTRVDFINSENLERRDTQIRIDRFITETFRRETPPQAAVVAPSREPNKGVFRSRTGLATHVREATGLERIRVNGQPVSFPEQKYTRIDFTPGHRDSFVPSAITNSLANGILGMAELMSAIDEGKVEVASVFVGQTNINMALIAQRMGFELADSCRKEDGTIDTGKARYTVVGRLEKIRQKVKEFQASGRAARITTRNQRLEGAPA